jgi:hypothetical protein
MECLPHITGFLVAVQQGLNLGCRELSVKRYVSHDVLFGGRVVAEASMRRSRPHTQPRLSHGSGLVPSTPRT